MQHSPIPWEIRDTQTHSKFTTNWREIYAANRPIICAASYDSSSDGTVSGVQTNKADAEFIVCACNCHDDLFKALVALLSDIEADPLSSAYFDLRNITAAQDIIKKVRQYERESA